MFNGFGVCTSVIGHRNILTPEKLTGLKKSGIEYIEISALQTLHFDIHNKRHLESVSKSVKKLGLKIWSVHAPFTPIAMPDRATREEGIELMVETCALRKYFDFDKVVLHPGSDDNNGDRKQELRNLEKSLKVIAKRTGKIKLAVETTSHYAPKSTERLLRVINEFAPEKVGMCIDTGHANLSEDVPEIIRKAGKRIFTVHMQDNDGKTDLHLLPMSGIIKWKEVCKAFNDAGYNGVFMFEAADEKLSLKGNVNKMRSIYNCLNK